MKFKRILRDAFFRMGKIGGDGQRRGEGQKRWTSRSRKVTTAAQGTGYLQNKIADRGVTHDSDSVKSARGAVIRFNDWPDARWVV